MSVARTKASEPPAADGGPPLKPPSADEQASITAARQRIAARAPRVSLKIASEKPGSPIEINPPHDDRAALLDRLQDAFGTRGMAFTTAELNHFILASRLADDKTDETRLNSLLAVVDGVRPANEIEAMLACQIAVTHRLAMDLVRRTQRAEQIPQFEANGRLAAKFLNAFASQVELLNRLQRGPAQHVRVEHVHVHQGGQAIVGNVASGRDRGGESAKSDNQPQAPQLNGAEPRPNPPAASPALPCQDPHREPLPIAGRQRQGALPDARRRAR